MDAKVIWNGRMSFDGSAGSGFHLPLGTKPESGGDNDGFRPLELLLVGLAGCTAMDVISILQKKRQDVTRFEVSVTGERADDHPMVFKTIEVEYIIAGNDVQRDVVERAVELSETKYCSASAMLGKTAAITHKITLI